MTSLKVRLGDVVDYQTGFPFKSVEYSSEGVKLLRGDNIGQGALRWDGVKFWPEATGDIGKFALAERDVVIAMDRPWIEAGLKYAAVGSSDLPCLLVQRVARLRGTERIDGGFLRYLVGSVEFTEHILNITTGTAVPHISGKDILGFEFEMPALGKQREIAAILGALDDKIELNRKTAATLEAMARALYRSWFVDFDPVHAKSEGRPPVHVDPTTAALFPDSFGEDGLPTGWVTKPVRDFARCELGGTPSRANPDFWGGSVPWINSGAVNSFRIVSPSEFLSESGWQQSSTKMPPLHTTVLAITGATLGQVSRTEIETCANQSVVGIVADPELNNFIYCAVKESIDELISHQTGGAQQHINKRNVEEHQLIWPSSDILNAFDLESRALFGKIAQLLFENQTLATLRDSLLPRLMSGDLRVGDAREQVEAVA